jgi:hypothetical protein
MGEKVLRQERVGFVDTPAQRRDRYFADRVGYRSQQLNVREQFFVLVS